MIMRVKQGTEGKTKDVDIIDVTPENYIVPDNEKHLYHCIIEVRKFDSESGKRLSVPRIQKFGKKSFENGVGSNLKKQGYTVTILHNPVEYLKQQAEEKAAKTAEATKAAQAQAAADAKAKEDAEKKAKAEERAALKAEILAELKTAGIIPAEPTKETKADAKAKEDAEKKAEAKK